MITPDQLADLQPGDVIRVTGWDGLTVEGPVDRSNADGGSLWLGQHVRLNFVIDPSVPSWMERPDATLTVVSRAPRPLYVNHPRTEPAPGDVVRTADSELPGQVFMFAPIDNEDSFRNRSGSPWITHEYGGPGGGLARSRDYLPARLRLLVDGETGRALPSEPAPTSSWCPTTEHHRRMVRSARAEGWAEGFEAAAEWAANNPGPSGVPHDPPSNPYETGQVVP